MSSSKKITKDEVKRIAQLSNVGLAENEIEKLQNEMESILDYVGSLEKIDTTDVEPTFHTIHLENVVREDSAKLSPAKKDLQSIEQSKFLDQAPQSHKEFFKTQAILSSKK
jgi:aspartyl-tRNA(Asn)/glutamyl-tRNA(Gln) amidotransferase subunit C